MESVLCVAFEGDSGFGVSELELADLAAVLLILKIHVTHLLKLC